MKDKDRVIMHLTITANWWLWITEYGKNEEYRTNTNWFNSRLQKFIQHDNLPHYICFHKGYSKTIVMARCNALHVKNASGFFSREYSFCYPKNRPTLQLRESWGFTENCSYVLELGELIYPPIRGEV